MSYDERVAKFHCEVGYSKPCVLLPHYYIQPDDMIVSMHAAQLNECMETLSAHVAACVCVYVSSVIRSFIFERFSSFLFLGDRNYTNRHCCVRFVEHIAVSVHVCYRLVYRRIFIAYTRARKLTNLSFIELHLASYQFIFLPVK